MRMKRLFFLTALLPGIFPVSQSLHAQITSLGPVLIGSTGNFQVNTPADLSISSSVGEPMVRTTAAPSLLLTEGFQQPEVSATFAMNMVVAGNGLSCNDANDGSASITPTGGTAPYHYDLFNGGSTPIQTSTNQTSGYTFLGLAPGSYTIVGTDNNGFVKVDTIFVTDNTEPCGIKIYKGLTPNGDGKNDTWVIDYLDLFNPNQVSIFSRWGDLIWEGNNYDNVNVVFSGKDLHGAELPDGTYFYLVTYDGKTRKGWLELSR